MDGSQRFLVLMAGLAGAAGVALSAVAAHLGYADIKIAAEFLLLHAAPLLVLATLPRPLSRTASLAAVLLVVGLLLFCGDLVCRDSLGHALFPFAAPSGGTLLIAGWLAVAAAALTGLRRER